jgi:hypothetical protein
MPPDDWIDRSDDELTSDDWLLFVVQGFADQLADPRQDIYTVADGVAMGSCGDPKVPR